MPDHLCRGVRIHVIDITQPPGIAMPPVADTVLRALTKKSSAEAPRKVHREAGL